MRPHRLTDAALTELGAGRPSPETLAELRRSQLSRHLLLLREIAAITGPGPFRALTEAERADPAATRRWIARPLVGVWATRCLTALRGGASPEDVGLDYLAQPTDHEQTVLRAEHDGLAVAVPLEDKDPLRAGLGLPPAPPLGAAATRRWQEAFTEAWRLLVTLARPDAEALTGILTCIVPVLPDPAARGISATSADAFGAVAISEPADADALAAGLLHETQHSLLNAVLYLFDMLEHPAERGWSPWRDDPRPASGILHGAYAYLTVTRFRRAQLRWGGDPLAAFEFARWRSAVAVAAAGLHDLTPAGARFVGALLDEVRPWLDEPVDPAIRRLAEGANTDHLLRWQLRNRTVAPADAAALAEAWRSGAQPPPVRSRLVPAPRRALEASARLDLAHRLLRHETVDGASGDGAYVLGDERAALRAYREMADFCGLALVTGLTAAPELAAATHTALAGEADPLELLRWLA
ncbi:aKG-HExxH-type peptide beta-hydroxylase [Symbioplanes lichenis]|uniref:aKG-HExxH-type peptide beta-hydroxylase n=1 Tax=Symbioplanes lichenis TaxID=1629072 RepID=UPI002739C0CB|nr:HEXXH motif-containing putative peptide modification protein [Actinoplanes lichenis]